jgi:tetratricopeptide (TPR) repeat protein
VVFSIGVIYANQGNNTEALKKLPDSFKKFSGKGNRTGIANSLNNIGIVYQKQGNYTEALINYQSL